MQGCNDAEGDGQSPLWGRTKLGVQCLASAISLGFLDDTRVWMMRVQGIVIIDGAVWRCHWIRDGKRPKVF